MTIVAIVLIIIALIVFIEYNKLIKLKNKVNQAKSGIDVYLNQRFDLIPNLVECVKAYCNHEDELLENVVKLRNIYEQNRALADATRVNDILNKILLISESYPELKASEQFLNLQKNLTKMESQLQAARRIYNNSVTNYNTKIQSVPTNIIASIFGFKERELFQMEEYKKENINIEL